MRTSGLSLQKIYRQLCNCLGLEHRNEGENITMVRECPSLWDTKSTGPCQNCSRRKKSNRVSVTRKQRICHKGANGSQNQRDQG
jgi:hypothetical protein